MLRAIQELGIPLGEKKNQAWLLLMLVIFLQRPQGTDAVAIMNISGTGGGQGVTFL